MNVRDNFRSFFRFFPIFKWTLWCNEKPDIPRGTEGIWRRVKVVLWESHLEPHQRDRALPDKLKQRSEEHTSELQSLMSISYAVFCLKKKNRHTTIIKHTAT